MNLTLKRIEKIIIFLILPSVLILVILVILQLFFEDIIEEYSFLISILEYSIIILFISDLGFKYSHIKKFKPFLKKHWLDILVVFPFFILFSSIERAFVSSSKLLYSTLNVENEISLLLKDSEKTTETIRKVNKIWPRIIRILKIINHK